MNYTTEIYIWDQAKNNEQQHHTTQHTIMATPTRGMHVSQKAHFHYLDNKLSIWTKIKVVRRKHIIQPTGFGAYSWTRF